MGLFGSHSVSPVEVSLNLATATISPAEADPTGFCFFPSRRKIWPIRSLAFFPAFRGDMSGGGGGGGAGRGGAPPPCFLFGAPLPPPRGERKTRKKRRGGGAPLLGRR